MKIFKIIFFLFTFFIFCFVNAENKPIDLVFKDINKNYKYYDELQFLYDRWIFYPDKNWNFNPWQFLKREEFVWIVSEISCNECIKPNTDFSLVQKYENSEIFFDIKKENDYFYCVADSLEKKKVAWYKEWTACQDWTQKAWERPFCPNNNIILEEALAIILRDWNILSSKEAEEIRNEIQNWKKFENILNISPKLKNGSVYSFYPDFKKAFEYSFKDFDKDWYEKKLKLWDFWKTINPKKYITKEDFLRISYISLKNNSCKEKAKNDFWLKIEILEKSCSETKIDCEVSDFSEKEKTFDFRAKISNFNWDWFKYNWRFYNFETWKEFKRTWPFLDNISLDGWKYRVFLIGNWPNWEQSQVFSDLKIKKWWDEENPKNNLKIIISNHKCSENISFCEEESFPNKNKIFDISWKWPWDSFEWEIENLDKKTSSTHTWDFINNKIFEEWNYKITLIWRDINWKKISTEKIIKIWENNKNNKKDSWFTSHIIVDKITATPWENINFTWITNKWGNPKFYWDFWDWKKDFWKSKTHNYGIIWNYKINLTVIDENWNNSSSTVNIKISNNPWIESDGKDSDQDWVPDEIDNEINTPKNRIKFICTLTHIKEKKYWCLEKDLWVYNPNIEREGEKWKDSDWDWVLDHLDLCKNIKWDKNNNWCPIFEEKCSVDSDCKEWSYCENWFCKLKNYNLNCNYKWWNVIIWKSECNSCPCNINIDFNSNLRECDVIFPAITSPDQKDIYSKWKYFQIKKLENL